MQKDQLYFFELRNENLITYTFILVGWASRPSRKGGRDTPQTCVNYLIRDPKNSKIP